MGEQRGEVMWTVRRMAQCLRDHPEHSTCMLTCESPSLSEQCLTCPCLTQLIPGIPRNTDSSSASIREIVRSMSCLLLELVRQKPHPFWASCLPKPTSLWFYALFLGTLLISWPTGLPQDSHLSLLHLPWEKWISWQYQVNWNMVFFFWMKFL